MPESVMHGKQEEFVCPEERTTAVQESGNGGRMVRTKRTKATQDSRQETKRDSEEDVTAIVVAAESLQERQRCAFAKTVADAVFGDASSRRLVTKVSDDAISANQFESTSNGFSQAALWAAEPEWTGEASEETAETWAGRREPEE